MKTQRQRKETPLLNSCLVLTTILHFFEQQLSHRLLLHPRQVQNYKCSSEAGDDLRFLCWPSSPLTLASQRALDARPSFPSNGASLRAFSRYQHLPMALFGERKNVFFCSKGNTCGLIRQRRKAGRTRQGHCAASVHVEDESHLGTRLVRNEKGGCFLLAQSEGWLIRSQRKRTSCCLYCPSLPILLLLHTPGPKRSGLTVQIVSLCLFSP